MRCGEWTIVCVSTCICKCANKQVWIENPCKQKSSKQLLIRELSRHMIYNNEFRMISVSLSRQHLLLNVPEKRLFLSHCTFNGSVPDHSFFWLSDIEFLDESFFHHI